MMNTNDVLKPNGLTDEHLEYLDDLRESGVTNMFGAGPYIAAEFDLNESVARKYLSFWMQTYSERHATAE
jgi:hypothetical protein